MTEPVTSNAPTPAPAIRFRQLFEVGEGFLGLTEEGTLYLKKTGYGEAGPFWDPLPVISSTQVVTRPCAHPGCTRLTEVVPGYGPLWERCSAH